MDGPICGDGTRVSALSIAVRRLLTLFVRQSFLVLVVTTQGLAQSRCHFQYEIEAEVAITFFFSQTLRAGLCDKLVPEYGLLETSNRILEKFDPEYSNYFFTQRRQYRRLFGDRGEGLHSTFLKAHSDMLANAIAPGISKAECTRFLIVLESRLAAGWENVENVIKAEANRYAPQLPRCMQ